MAGHMAGAGVWTGLPFFVNTNTLNTTTNDNAFVLKQLQNLSFQPNYALNEHIEMGAVDVSAHTVITADPSFTGSTTDLDGLFNMTGLATGLCIPPSNATAPGLAKFQWQERSQCGTFQTGSGAFVGIDVENGGIIQTSTITIETESQEGVTADFRFDLHNHNDGQIHIPLANYSDALATAGGALNPAMTPGFNQRYYMAHTYRNTGGTPPVLLDLGVRRIVIDTGNEFKAVRQDGETYPRTHVLISRKPTVTFTVDRPDEFIKDFLPNHDYDNHFDGSTNPALTVDIDDHRGFMGGFGDDIRIQLQRGSTAGTRVAKGSSQHIRIIVPTDGFMTMENITASQNDDATIDFTIRATSALTYALTTTLT
jgi:hypothetical protein